MSSRHRRNRKQNATTLAGGLGLLCAAITAAEPVPSEAAPHPATR